MQPVAVESAVDACVRTLKLAILRQELPAGEKLPGERELASQLGVSRNTLRSALVRLEQERLVSVRHGVGIVALDPAEEGGPALIVSLANEDLDPALVEDLLAVRRSLARAVIAALPARVDAAALRRVDEAIDRLDAGLGLRPEQFAALDVDVARALVAATGRIGLRLCMNPVLDVLPRIPELCRAMFRDRPSHVRGWRSVRAWLDHPDPSAADALIGVLEARDADTLAALERP